ncbi:hypothetical protein IL54_4414 [Sphingobium sp. ba1]|nr:hypothetical protein IL54_0342 [Sphingobium sp. ba1]KFL48696.1 hypothetical protein IL54_4414 [Sphingobium sp. ba1]
MSKMQLCCTRQNIINVEKWWSLAGSNR